MANPIWTGATDGDFNKTTNWSIAAVPLTGDSVFYTQVPLNPCNINMNQTGKNFVQVVVSSAMLLDVGSAANPLIAGIDRLEFAGPASGYFTSDGDTNPIDNFVQQSGLVFLQPLGSTSALALATISGGQCNLEDGRVTKMIVSPRLQGGALVNIAEEVDLLTTLQLRNGTVVSSCKVHDVIEVRDAQVTLENDAAITTGGAILTVHSGTVRYDCSGNTTTVAQYDGLVTAANNRHGVGTISIGSTIYELWGGRLDMDNGSRNITAVLKIKGRDHSVRFATEKTVTLGDI